MRVRASALLVLLLQANRRGQRTVSSTASPTLKAGSGARKPARRAVSRCCASAFTDAMMLEARLKWLRRAALGGGGVVTGGGTGVPTTGVAAAFAVTAAAAAAAAHDAVDDDADRTAPAPARGATALAAAATALLIARIITAAMLVVGSVLVGEGCCYCCLADELLRATELLPSYRAAKLLSR